jgi:metal-sulfur cluster biosynthetic enzyme
MLVTNPISEIPCNFPGTFNSRVCIKGTHSRKRTFLSNTIFRAGEKMTKSFEVDRVMTLSTTCAQVVDRQPTDAWREATYLVNLSSGGMMLTREVVVEALEDCYDPEIPVNIVDLGLVYDVRLDGTKVEVDFTLTAPGCGMAYMIRDDIHAKLSAIQGVGDVVVNIVWEPAWTPDRMSENARKALGFG